MLLSIITINRNNLSGLRHTAESILTQTDQTFEWIVVDGGSTDGSAVFVKSITRQNTTAISEPDTGIYNAMNKGTRLAHGDYCLYLNSGDSLHDNGVVQRVLQELSKADADIYRGNVDFIYNGYISGRYYAPHSADVKTGKFWFVNYVHHQGAVIRRLLLLKYPYREDFLINSDCHFFRQAYLLEGVSDRTMDIVISDYDTTGISSKRMDIAWQEREKSWKMLFGNAVYDDYVNLTSGKGPQGSTLQRMVCDLRRGGEFWTRVGAFFLIIPIIFQRAWTYVRRFCTKYRHYVLVFRKHAV